MLSRRYENRPRTTRAMIIIVARTGRLMDRSLRNTGSTLPAHDFHQVADLESFHRPDDGDVALLQAAGDLHEMLHLVEHADGHVATLDPPLRHHQHVAGSLVVAPHPGLPDRERAFHLTRHHPPAPAPRTPAPGVSPGRKNGAPSLTRSPLGGTRWAIAPATGARTVASS